MLCPYNNGAFGDLSSCDRHDKSTEKDTLLQFDEHKTNFIDQPQP